MMRLFPAIAGIVLILVVLWDSFETVVLPRRVTRKYRFTRLFYRSMWILWSRAFSAIAKGKRLETCLSYFGPLSLILLLSVWAAGLVFGFGLLNWGFGLPVKTSGGEAGLGIYLYLSGTSFFTLGLGDVVPVDSLSRALTVLESGLGFAFLALVLGYLPALNQSFSRREVNISLQDARAGSPSTAAEMLRRECSHGGIDALLRHLGEWEHWSAELLESHLSYPVLAYFRSQHDNQSWLAALTVILDTSAFAIAALEGSCARQARLTFAIARHAIVDLSLVFRRHPLRMKHERLDSETLHSLLADLKEADFPVRQTAGVEQALTDLRGMYEPYVHALSRYFRLRVPDWKPDRSRRDNWQTSAWEKRGGKKGRPTSGEEEEEHF